MCGDFLTKFSQFVGVGDLSKKNLKIGGQPPNLGVGEGQIFRYAPARRRLVAKLYYVDQPAFVPLLGNGLPYNIYPPLAKTPETFSPEPAKVGLIFENFDFFPIFEEAPFPQSGRWGRCLGCDLLYSGRTIKPPNFSCLSFLVPEI